MRDRLSLNGSWQYTPEAHVTYRAEGAFSERTDSLPTGGQMELPINWQLGGLDNFHGRVRFERRFSLDGFGDDAAQLWLHFTAVDYFAEVWLNGTLLGRHEGYFQPFRFDVTELLVSGENHLIVNVTCPLEEPGAVWPDRKRMIKGILSHWDCRPGSWDLSTGQDKNSGGIWHDVYLEATPAAYLEDIRVQTQLVPRNAPTAFDIAMPAGEAFDPDGPQQAIVQVNATIQGPAGIYTLTVKLGDEPEVEQEIHVMQRGQRVTVVVQVPEPKLWWTWDLGDPHLEQLQVALAGDGMQFDQITLDVGLREIDFDEARGEWWLNGKRFFLRGTNVIPTMWLSEYSAEMIARDIELLRAAHINGVRVCVHVNRPEFYAACDRAGILIWQDFALQWGYVVTREFMQEAVRQVKEMVRMLVNHPSIGLWCCQNESSLYNAHVLGPALAAAIAEEDGTRPIHSHSDFAEHAYAGWYRGHYREYAALPGTPVLTEFGAQSLPRVETMHAISGGAWPPDWKQLAYHDFQYDQTFHVAGVEMGESWQEFIHNSQHYQARLLKYAIEGYRRQKYEALGGLFQFMFMDCWPSITWAVVEYDRTPKMAYQTLQEVFQPVLIGHQLERERLPLEADLGSHLRPLVLTPWIVNDLHDDLIGCTYVASLVSGETERSWQTEECFTVPADSVYDAVPAVAIAEPLQPGAYELIFTLLQGDKTLSVNRYSVEIVSLPA